MGYDPFVRGPFPVGVRLFELEDAARDRRLPAETRRMVVLRRADHEHFVDDVEGTHETARTMPLPPEAAYLQAEARPMTELCNGEQAHTFVRGLTLAHLDATLRNDPAAARLLAGNIEGELAARGVEATVPRP